MLRNFIGTIPGTGTIVESAYIVPKADYSGSEYPSIVPERYYLLTKLGVISEYHIKREW